MKKRLEETRLRQEAENKLRRLKAELEDTQARNKERGMIVTSQQLLDILAIDTMQIQDEVVIILRKGQNSDPYIHNRSHLLMQSPRFHVWLTSNISGCLLVDGNAQSASERISAMTVVSAMLAQNLPGESETASVIQFFCGLHTDQDENLSGPRGLLRSLLAQLVHIFNLQLNFVHSNEYDEFKRFHTSRLCVLIGVLIKQLPKGSVLFCIIDGISLYENDDWMQETSFALRKIIDLSYDPQVQATFKVLITSPLASRYIARHISAQDHLALPRDSAENDGTPLTRRQFMMQSRRRQEKGATLGDSRFGQSRHMSDDGFDESFDNDEVDEEVDEGFVEGDFNEGNFGER